MDLPVSESVPIKSSHSHGFLHVLLIISILFNAIYGIYFYIQQKEFSNQIAVQKLPPIAVPTTIQNSQVKSFVFDSKKMTFAFRYPLGWQIVYDVIGKNESGYYRNTIRINRDSPLLSGQSTPVSDYVITHYVPSGDKQYIKTVPDFISDIASPSSSLYPTPAQKQFANPNGITVWEVSGPDRTTGAFINTYYFLYTEKGGENHFVTVSLNPVTALNQTPLSTLSEDLSNLINSVYIINK